MDNRAIGIFDSGLGGLTALAALRRLMPNENLIYFADSARVPYGGRAAEELRKMTAQDLDFLASFSVKAILAACGTASSTAADVLDAYPLPVFGVLRATVGAVAAEDDGGPVAVIATEASIRAGSFKRALEKALPGREVIALACPDFVPLIEGGHIEASDPRLKTAVSSCLGPLRSAGVSSLVLGCTHYGIIGEAIAAYLGPSVRLVSASECAAKELREHLVSEELTGGQGETRYFTSGSVSAFSRSASALLGGADVRAEQASLMEVKDI